MCPWITRPPVFCMIFDKMMFLIDADVGVSNLWQATSRHLPSKHLSGLSNYWPLKVELGSMSSILHSKWDKRHLLLSEALKPAPAGSTHNLSLQPKSRIYLDEFHNNLRYSIDSTLVKPRQHESHDLLD